MHAEFGVTHLNFLNVDEEAAETVDPAPAFSACILFRVHCGRKETWSRTVYPTVCIKSRLLLSAESAERMHAEKIAEEVHAEIEEISKDKISIRMAFYASLSHWRFANANSP